MCCSVLQCVAVCCSVKTWDDNPPYSKKILTMSQRSMLKCVVACCSVLQYVAVCCSVLQYIAVSCHETSNAILENMLQYIAGCCSVVAWCITCSICQYVEVLILIVGWRHESSPMYVYIYTHTNIWIHTPIYIHYSKNPNVPHSHVWHDSFMYVTWRIHISDMNHLYV